MPTRLWRGATAPIVPGACLQVARADSASWVSQVGKARRRQQGAAGLPLGLSREGGPRQSALPSSECCGDAFLLRSRCSEGRAAITVPSRRQER